MKDSAQNDKAIGEGEPQDTERSFYRVTINAPIHKVWAELTRTDTVLPFFFNSVCKTTGLAPGAPVRMVSKNGKYAAVVGEVLEFDPPYRYAHTFKFTSLDDPMCVVRYVLREVDGGTEFTLVSEGVAPGTKSEKYMASGSKFIADNLKAWVENGRPTASGRFALFMMGLTSFMTPARCRTDNWPLDRKIS